MKYYIPFLLLSISANSHAKVLHVKNKQELKKRIDQKPTVIKFSATWCGPCQMAKTPFAEVSNMPEFAHVAFVGVDVDQQQAIADVYNVTALPTFVFVRGGSVLAKKEGLLGADSVLEFKQNLVQKLETLFNKPTKKPKKEKTVAPKKKKTTMHEEHAPKSLVKTEKQTEEKAEKKSALDQISDWFNDGLEYISNLFRS